MPGSAVLAAGVLVALVAVGLLWSLRLTSRDVATGRRLLRRVLVGADEIERVDRARRQFGDGVGLVRGGTDGVHRIARRSGTAIAGIPYAILDSIVRLGRNDDGT